MLHWDKSQLPQGDRASQGRPGEGVGQREGLGPWGAGTGLSSPPPHTHHPHSQIQGPLVRSRKSWR